MVKEHPEAYPAKADFRIDAVRLRDQITSPARTVLLVLLAASALVFVIACSNVANLILARSVRREGELAIRAALGASAGALRRTLLAESLLLCGAGAVLGVLIARPMVAILARYASRFSVRALDLTVDASLLWVGVGAGARRRRAAGVRAAPAVGGRVDGLRPVERQRAHHAGTNRRLRLFAVTQIAASFVLLAGAGMLLTTLLALQAAPTGFDTRNVLALNVPVMSYGRTPEQIVGFYKEAMRRIRELPGVERVAVGTIVPWRDAGTLRSRLPVLGRRATPRPTAKRIRARGSAPCRPDSSRALGVPIIAGRDFNDADRRDAEQVVIVSQSLAQRMFPTQDARQPPPDVDRSGHEVHRRQHRRRAASSASPPTSTTRTSCPGRRMTVYHPFEQEIGGGRLFVHAQTDPYALVPPITRIIRDLSADQPVERAATLDDIRAEVLAPDRLNALVFGGFAAVALRSRSSASPACWRSR